MELSLHTHRRAPRRAGVAALAMAAGLLAAACQRVPVRVFDDSHPSAFNVHYLTRSGGDTYSSGTGPGRFTLSAPATNTGHNTRVLVYPPAQPMASDQVVCATWSSQVGINTQQGLALRIRHDLPNGGRWRAVTVMKNILWGAHWQFNVITWDTQGGYGYRTQGSVGLPQVFWPNQVLAPLPWRVCAKAEGDIVTIKAWRLSETEPAWGDASHGGSVRLPPGWAFAGKAGWYAGHLPPGGSAALTALTADRLVVTP